MSESAYYAQCKAVKTPQKHTALSPEIKSLFVESRGSAGKRTLRDLLRQKSIFVGLYLIQKLMKQQGLFSKQPQKWQNRNKENGQIFTNHLNREFTPNADTTVLCGDTTYLKVNGIWCYLTVVINLFNRQVVGWKLSRYHDSELVVEALHHAMLNVKKTAKMIFHSD
ncbi:DDE-type integrase/transposase/recombinase [Aggregatibacter actinomycetemcomitans]|nr:DDE-type integrase/transposase/recombinase [Aggregatibacter actinomycetemcomitans]